MRIPSFDEPEPDIAIIRGSDADYRGRLPTAADVALLVEVSESTLRQDRGQKRTAYARAGIPVYWIVNLVDRQVEVYTRPVKAGRDRSRKVLQVGAAGPGRDRRAAARPIPVDDILP